MLNKIKSILKYATRPDYFIEAIRNPRKIVEFFKKNLIIDPQEFLVALLKQEGSEIGNRIQELSQEKKFHNYVWKKYKQFEEQIIGEKKDKSAGGASEKVGIILYATIRLLKPEIVLETGVASGISSAYILAALARNQKGELISIDLPYEVDKKYALDYIEKEAKVFIPKGEKPGWLIPPELKKRWRLILGKSFNELPKVLKELKRVDIFIHDSEHSYKNMFWEYETVWPFLKEKGLLFSHDITWNKAFDNFCQKIERKGVKYRLEFGGIKK